MTDAEFGEVVAYVTRLWPHAKHVDGMWDVARRFIIDLSASETVAAIDRLAATGREFPPPAGAIRREAVMEELIDYWAKRERLLARGVPEADLSDLMEKQRNESERRLTPSTATANELGAGQ